MVTPQPSWVITGVGMSSCFGSVVDACAAARAGLSGAQGLDVFIPESGEIEPEELRGCPVPTLMDYEDYSRLAILAASALTEAVSQAAIQLTDSQDTQFLFVLPDPAQRPALDDIYDIDTQFPRGYAAFFTERVESLSGLDLSCAGISEGGNAELLRVIHRIISSEDPSGNRRYVITAVDSYIEPENLEWLASIGRLKSATFPSGLVPGEGAATLVLERSASAILRRVTECAKVLKTEYEAAKQVPSANQDSLDTEDELPIRLEGTALARTILAVCGDGGVQPSTLGGVFIDLNGEAERARYWGANLPLLVSNDPMFSKLPVTTVASNFGDLGVATSTFHICLAVRAFARNYAQGESFLIVSVGDEGAVGALALSRGETS